MPMPISCVTLGNPLRVSEPQFPYCQRWAHICIYLMFFPGKKKINQLSGTSSILKKIMKFRRPSGDLYQSGQDKKHVVTNNPQITRSANNKGSVLVCPSYSLQGALLMEITQAPPGREHLHL